MSPEGIDISNNETNSVNEFIDGQITFDSVVMMKQLQCAAHISRDRESAFTGVLRIPQP